MKTFPIIPHLGTHGGDDVIIAHINRARNNIEKAQKIDWSEVEPAKLEKIHDILNDEFECDECNRKEEKAEKIHDEIYGFSLYLHDVISHASFYLEGEALKEFEKKVELLRKHKLNNHKEFDMDF